MSSHKGLILIVLTAIISGVSIFINSFAVKMGDSSVFTFSKNAVVAFFLFCIIMAYGRLSQLRSLSRKQWLSLSLIGFVGGSIPFLLFFRGLQLTTGSTSAFLHKTLFLYAAIFALIFLKERLTKGLFIGAVLLLIGNYLLLLPDFTFSYGHVLVIIAVLFWAAENTYSKHILREVPGTIVAFGRMFFGSLFILVFLFATGKGPLLLDITLPQLSWILLTSLLLLLYVLTFYNGLESVKVSTAACILSLGSPITTLLSWIFLGQSASIVHVVALLTIAGGVAFILAMRKPFSLPFRQAS